MIRVADYLFQTLVAHGIRDVFLVTGGAAMHLNDAIGRTQGLSWLCCHHEQACAMAAASYYRLTNRPAAVNVTAGPGGTNAITGVFGAWTESLGMIVVSGQVKFETTVGSTSLPLRQLGDQEADIVQIVKPITKYAVMVTDPQSIRYHVEKAIYLATEGRPGPVWLDVPMNVQGALVDPDTLEGFLGSSGPRGGGDLDHTADEIVQRLAQSERPAIFAGSGIRLGRAEREFLELVDRWRIPVVTGFNAHDLLWDEHPCNIGRQGTIGDRAGNFAIQNADFLLILGSRLTIRQISYNWESFARDAYKVVVDIDEAELQKPTVRPDLAVHADVADLLGALKGGRASRPPGGPEARPPKHEEWLRWCQERKVRYPVVLPEYADDTRGVNSYMFVKSLFQELADDAIVVTGDGTACVTTFQAAALKRGQRLYSDGGCAPMGFDLPAAIGAAIASGRKRIVCLAGDGSIQMNIQELQTIVTNQLPITIFVLNNYGYLSIRLTQKSYFPDNPVGYDPSSGVGIPNFSALAAAYGLGYRAIRKHADLASLIREAIDSEGPQMCEIFLDPEQAFAPKTSSRRLPDGRMVSAPLEDMFPFLDREELESNMIIPTVKDVS